MRVHLVKDPVTRQQQLDTLMMGCFARDKEMKRLWPGKSFPDATLHHYDPDTVEIIPFFDGGFPPGTLTVE